MALPIGTEPRLPPPSLSSSINGTDSEVIERYKITEIMNGFAAHRDACEWTKMRALFAKEDAYMFVTWAKGLPIDEFTKISKDGFTKGVRAAHRVNGSTVDLSKSGDRAVGKLKAYARSIKLRRIIDVSSTSRTITQRVTMPSISGEPCEVDVEGDCRLCFLLQKYNSEWKTHFFKGFYEKDKAIPVNPAKVPHFDEAKLASFPDGYKYLAYIQSPFNTINMDLPQSQGEEHDRYYDHFMDWLEGKDLASVKGSFGV